MAYNGHEWYYFIDYKEFQYKSFAQEDGKTVFFFGFYPNISNIGKESWSVNVYRNKGIEPYVHTLIYDKNGNYIQKQTSESDVHDYTQKMYTRSIYENHWKIPDDYPIKF